MAPSRVRDASKMAPAAASKNASSKRPCSPSLASTPAAKRPNPGSQQQEDVMSVAEDIIVITSGDEQDEDGEDSEDVDDVGTVDDTDQDEDEDDNSEEDGDEGDEDEDNNEGDDQQSTSDESQQEEDGYPYGTYMSPDEGQEEEEDEEAPTPASSQQTDDPVVVPVKPRRTRKVMVSVVTRYWAYNNPRRSYDAQEGEEVVGVYGQAEQVAAKCRELRANEGEGEDDEGYDMGNEWEVDNGEETVGCKVTMYPVDISDGEEEDERNDEPDEYNERWMRKGHELGFFSGYREAESEYLSWNRHKNDLECVFSKVVYVQPFMK